MFKLGKSEFKIKSADLHASYSSSSYDKEDGERHNTWRCVPKDVK